MDKFKDFLANVQKYHFWILCALVVIIGFASWYMATSSLNAQTTENANKIKARDGEIQTVKNTPDHPNANFLTGMDNLIVPQSSYVATAWNTRYEQQKSLLVWPATLTKEAEGFIEQVDHLRPIESLPFPTPREKEIDSKYIQAYRNFITRELPRLAEIIGAKWRVQGGNDASGPGGGSSIFNRPVAGPEAGGPGGGLPGQEVDNSIVIWNEANQKHILDVHFPFASNNSTPTTLEVLYAQEDLWVLEAIMRIIKKTNGGADANYNAPIKEISTIQIGPTARGRMGKIIPVQKRMAAASPAGPGGLMPTSSPSSPGVPPGTAATDTEKSDPAFERYVDNDYNPLPVSTLRTAATSTDPKVAIYSVAKRIPVRLRLFMDQRNLSDLLAHCGNFNLPIEVRQVRINCPEGLVSDDSQLGGGGMGMMMPPGGGGEMGRGGGGMGFMPTPSGSSGAPRQRRKPPGQFGLGGEEAKVDPNEIEVEVYGIVHIFNPVNEKQLGIELRRTPEASNDKPGTVVSPTAAAPVAGSNPIR